MNSIPSSSEADDLTELRKRLAEAEETLRAIGSGEVDAVIGTDQTSPQVYTLKGVGESYRALIESMNEGALTLTTDKMILYANSCFAKMVQRPLEQVIGSSFKEFLAEEDRAPLRALLKSAGQDGSKVHLDLHLEDGAVLPVLISVRPLARNGSEIVTVGMVVTDMTKSRDNEESLRGFSQRLVQLQEAERERVAFELHGQITQLLCAIVVRCQTLADKLSPSDRSAQKEAIKLRAMVGEAAAAVESISRHLRPSVLDHLGLTAILDSDCREFATRTGVSVALNCDPLIARLPAETELAVYRIFQEALRNVGQHADARHVVVHLTQQEAIIKLAVSDDGVGCNLDHTAMEFPVLRGLGFYSMRERAAALGGALSVISTPGQGTAISAQIPLGKPLTEVFDKTVDPKL